MRSLAYNRPFQAFLAASVVLVIAGNLLPERPCWDGPCDTLDRLAGLVTVLALAAIALLALIALGRGAKALLRRL